MNQYLNFKKKGLILLVFCKILTRKTLRKFMLADHAFVSESSARIVVDGLDS